MRLRVHFHKKRTSKWEDLFRRVTCKRFGFRTARRAKREARPPKSIFICANSSLAVGMSERVFLFPLCSYLIPLCDFLAERNFRGAAAPRCCYCTGCESQWDFHDRQERYTSISVSIFPAYLSHFIPPATSQQSESKKRHVSMEWINILSRKSK